MDKKVLVISASPRKGGNSDILCDEFVKGARESNNQATKVSLREKNINFCNACGACEKTGVCLQGDDVKSILDLMMESDVIVMATPVYFYSISAQMKALIDRTVPIYQKLSDKEFYFIITAWDDNPKMLERTLECFRGFTDDCLSGAQEKGVILAAGVNKKGEVRKTTYMKQAYDMGKNV